MWRYNRLFIDAISFFLSLVVFLFVQIGTSKFFSTFSQISISTTFNEEEPKLEETIQVEEERWDGLEQLQSYSWGIVIEKIQLIAPISEGTTKEVMDQFVGHFKTTSTLEGNIGLAGHNRGYPVNYFQNLKSLQKGDSIWYKKGEIQKKYVIEVITVIREDDWTYLQNTEDNRITLITCVENEPEYRRCIQAIEKEESNEVIKN